MRALSPCRAPVVLALALVWAPAPVIADSVANPHPSETAPLEERVRSVFVTKFPLFIDWPKEAFASAGSPLYVCLLGNAAFDGEVRAAWTARGARGRPVVVESRIASEDLRTCHILLVGPSEEPRFAETLANLDGAATLTVSAVGGFARRGGGIGFLVREGKVAFEINLEAVRHAGLTVSSNLLELAIVVNGPL